MKRVAQLWHPDNAKLIINRPRDAQLAARAIKETAALHQDGDGRMQSLMERRLPHPSHRNTAFLETLTFLDAEAGLVVEALASFTISLEGRHPLMSHRAKSLIGQIVIEAGPTILANPTRPLPYKPEV